MSLETRREFLQLTNRLPLPGRSPSSVQSCEDIRCSRREAMGAALAAAFLAQSETEAVEKQLTTSFVSPVEGKQWAPDSYQFGQDCSYPTETEGVEKRWGQHLGEDMNLEPGTVIVAAGDGKVMHVGTHKGESRDKRNWGGLVILAHWITPKVAVYTLYGHLEINPKLKKGDFVKRGDELGKVAEANSEKNGHWKPPHCHSQVNVDPLDTYRGGPLSGYAQYYNEEGKFVNHGPPNRLLDNVAPSQVFAAKDPIAFLRAAEADPRRKE